MNSFTVVSFYLIKDLRESEMLLWILAFVPGSLKSQRRCLTRFCTPVSNILSIPVSHEIFLEQNDLQETVCYSHCWHWNNSGKCAGENNSMTVVWSCRSTASEQNSSSLLLFLKKYFVLRNSMLCFSHSNFQQDELVFLKLTVILFEVIPAGEFLSLQE